MYHAMTTQGGYDFGEVSSAFQKSIRRGREEDALYWGVELDISGYGEYVMKRLRVIASEDIGLADPNVCVQVRALYDTWKELRAKKDEAHHPERLFLIHALLLCVRAKKSRIVDACLNVVYGTHPAGKPIPDYALDKHTLRGKRLGRGMGHFLAEGCQLANAAEVEGDAEYQEAFRQMNTSGREE